MNHATEKNRGGHWSLSASVLSFQILSHINSEINIHSSLKFGEILCHLVKSESSITAPMTRDGNKERRGDDYPCTHPLIGWDTSSSSPRNAMKL